MEYTFEPKIVYYSAANGYRGFRSYFNELFNPAEYDALYILKGGPGTGKSSLMKNIFLHFDKNGYKCEAVRCSSDTQSLDGVIIRNGTKKAGILDGTAPHETDAKIPGAIDSIVNLGDHWNKALLKDSKEEILKLNSQKKKHYQNAYALLEIAGHLDELIFKKESIRCKVDDFLVNSIISNFCYKTQGRISKSRLISAFEKDGYTSILPDKSYISKQIQIVGSSVSNRILLSKIQDKIRTDGLSAVVLTSPLSEEIIEGIYFSESKVLLSSILPSQEVISSDFFIENESDKEMINSLTVEYKNILDYAKEEFCKASDTHKKLEDIYTPAMNFDAIAQIRNKLIEEIEFSIS